MRNTYVVERDNNGTLNGDFRYNCSFDKRLFRHIYVVYYPIQRNAGTLYKEPFFLYARVTA